jgi:hypothetical protein
MKIPVVLKNGTERSVSKTEFELLMNQDRIMFFERADGWVVIGRDKLREDRSPSTDETQQERRASTEGSWY